MDANDCILSIFVSYNEKSLKMKSENIITIDAIKEEIVKQFNVKKEDKKYMKLLFKNNEKEIFINSDDDIILNADNSDIDNPKLNLNLLIEHKKEEEEKNNEEQKDNKEEKENNEQNIQHEKSISNEENKNNDNKIINNDNNITPTPKGDDDKYDELKKLIENLSNEIKVLKDEQINQTKKMEENNLNIKNEINQNKIKIEEIYNNKNNIQNLKNEINLIIKDNIEKEISRINEENKVKYKNIDELFKKNENEIEGIKSQITNFINSLKKIDEFETNYNNYIKNSEIKFTHVTKIIEEKYNSNMNNLTEKLSEQFIKIKPFEESIKKINEIISSLQKDMNELKKISNNKYEDRLASSFDNLQNFPKLEIYEKNNSINNNFNIIPENSNNFNISKNNVLSNSINEMIIGNSYNNGLTEDNSKNKDNNISKEESQENNINNLKSNNNNNDISFNLEKINEIKIKYPVLKNYPNDKLHQLIIDSKENLDNALANLILNMSSPNE